MKKTENYLIESISRTVRNSSVRRSLFFGEVSKISMISSETYLRLFTGLGGFTWLFITIFANISFVIAVYISLLNGFEWIQAEDSLNDDNLDFLVTFATWAVIATLISFTRKFTILIGFKKLNQELHSKMVHSVLHSKLNKFIQQTPLGMLVNRFVTDFSEIEDGMGCRVNEVATHFQILIVIMAIIIYPIEQPFLLIPIVLNSGFGIYSRRFHMRIKRNVARLKGVTMSSIMTTLLNCFAGAAVIRSLKNEEYFGAKMGHFLDESHKNWLLSYGLDGFYTFLLNFSSSVLLIAPSFAILIFEICRSTKEEVEVMSFQTGMSILALLCYNFIFESILRLLCELEINMISLERCQDLEDLRPEDKKQGGADPRDDPFTIPHCKKDECRLALQNPEPAKLLLRGRINIVDVSARYPDSSTEAINNLDLSAQPGQFIGVIGKSGSGKSSLVNLLVKMLTPYTGKILIDGKNIKTMNAKQLRSYFTIISQNSGFYIGNIEENLSQSYILPEEQEKILKILAELGFPSQKLKGNNLGFQLDVGAANLSKGERQILNLVRSIYKRRLIVVLDEATSYLDLKTEKLFLKKMRQYYQGSTVFVISKKVDVVLECDKILVMRGGEVVESGTKEELLTSKVGSIFAELFKNRD